jgi:hypothetical protein
MFWRFLTKQRQHSWPTNAARQGSLCLQVALWLLWSLAVIGAGYASWHADLAAQRPINTLGLVIQCLVAGLIGLVALTWIEMRFEPWRFIDED